MRPVGSTVDGQLAERPALPGRWRALAVSLVAAFMTLLDVSIVNVALPSIERGLGASAASVQWVVSGYALAFGLALVPAGRLGDSLGRRRMFLIALSAFVVTSALSGAAPTIGLLIAARLLQGVAGGMLIPQNSGLIQELFRGAERGRAFGILGATVGLATAAGPVIGGLILAAFAGPDGWRWVFYVNVPIGLVALVLAARLRAGRHQGRLARRPPGPGRVAAARRWRALPAAAAGRRRATAASTGCGRCSAWPWCCWPAFAWWEARTVRRGRQPLLDPQLARTSGYAAGSGHRAGLLHRVHRHLAGVRAVLPGRAGLLAAALRSGRDPVRAGGGGLGGDRRPAGGPGGALADGDRADHDRGRAGRHRAGAAARRWRPRRPGRPRGRCCWAGWAAAW